ncbi:zinc ribbon domain-containing protein [Halobellus sp. Atlit-38R]|uniref:zinc ribbon domain-containing protein n=1 Tax=Halobellus sp. Atlit-38R TaxID=2282131 RepID=UPI000EF1A23F|nr:zinc ribbon domain-containing protein [Halobellus sp. Atlit-38R]RLM94566.1 zinc ribbon domain-containing protein [Halobellus sp. Atlit-38R]
MTRTRRRAMIATLVAVLGASVGVAGAGHLYLREWRRGAAWFSFVIGAALVLLSVFVDPTTVSLTDPASVAAMQPSSLPTIVTAPLFALLLLSALDAYRLATRGPTSTDAPQCPNCGGEIDPEISFCPWCTVEFENYPVEDGDVGDRRTEN